MQYANASVTERVYARRVTRPRVLDRSAYDAAVADLRGQLRGAAAGRAGAAGQGDEQPVPHPRRHGAAAARRVGVRRRAEVDPVGPHRGRAGHDDVRGARRRDAAARARCRWSCRSSRRSPSAARSPGSASRAAASATARRTSRCSRWTCSPATAGSCTVTPDGEHADLFRGFPNSYGTLGYALRLRIELEPVQPYVHLRHVACGSVDEAAALLQVREQRRLHDGRAGRLRRRRLVLARPRST